MQHGMQQPKRLTVQSRLRQHFARSGVEPMKEHVLGADINRAHLTAQFADHRGAEVGAAPKKPAARRLDRVNVSIMTT